MTCSTLIKPVAAGAVLAMASSAYAGPFDPSFRGEANSVHAIFDWVSIDQNDWDTTLFETGPSPFPLDPATPLATDDGLDTVVDLPNFIDPLPLKRVRIQLFFDGAVPGDAIGFDVSATDPLGGVTVTADGGTVDEFTDAHFFDFLIEPNPDFERIIIFGDTAANVVPGNLLRIEIDTISIPAPATLPAAGLGLLALTRRRR